MRSPWNPPTMSAKERRIAWSVTAIDPETSRHSMMSRLRFSGSTSLASVGRAAAHAVARRLSTSSAPSASSRSRARAIALR